MKSKQDGEHSSKERDIRYEESAKGNISRVFKMTNEEEGTCYLGMHVEQQPGHIKLHEL